MFKKSLLIVLLSACMVGDPFLPTWPSDKITLRVENNFYGTALVRLRLYNHGSETPLLTVTQAHETITLPLRADYGNHVLLLRAYGQEPWVSEDLYFLKRGDCYKLVIGAQLKYSGLYLCGQKW